MVRRIIAEMRKCLLLRKDKMSNGCGGLSDVHVHAPPVHMRMYGTAKETEQMLPKVF